MSNAIKSKWLTISEAAGILGVSRQRVHQLLRELDIRPQAINPRLSMISRAALAKIKKARKNI
jgi:hypothetical protein